MVHMHSSEESHQDDTDTQADKEKSCILLNLKCCWNGGESLFIQRWCFYKYLDMGKLVEWLLFTGIQHLDLLHVLFFTKNTWTSCLGDCLLDMAALSTLQLINIILERAVIYILRVTKEQRDPVRSRNQQNISLVIMWGYLNENHSWSLQRRKKNSLNI